MAAGAREMNIIIGQNNSADALPFSLGNFMKYLSVEQSALMFAAGTQLFKACHLINGCFVYVLQS